MNKNNENKLVPRLRFPEFENAGEWEVKRLGEVFKSFSGGTPDTSKKEYYNGKIPFIRSAEIGKLSTELFITETGLENSSAKMVKKGDLLVALYGANSGDVAISKIDGAINQAILCFQSEYSNEFTCHFLSGKKNWIVSKYVQGGQGNLSGEIVKSISLPFPSLPEQQKIAACLSSLDEVITAESQKLELYQQHKKGLLQNLFPKAGETVPKFRFKEFEDSGEWKSDIAKNVFSIFQGFAFSSNDSVDNGVRWLKIADVGIQQINHQSPSNLPIEFKEKYKDFLVKEGDYVIALTRPILNKKLKISKVDNILNESLLNQRVGKLISNECIDFVYYLLQTSKLISTIEQNIAGSEPPNLSTQQIENIEVCIPSTIEEQQKIAACLSSLDDLINAQRQKIELLKQHKKGLLQGLFPPINN